MTYIPEYSCAVLSEISLKRVVEMYGRQNCHFGKLWEKFNYTEAEFIFSFATSKFQHLIDFESI